MYKQYTATKKYIFLVVLNLFVFEIMFAQGKFQNSNVILPVPSVQAIKQTITSSQKKLGFDLLQLTNQKYLSESVALQSHAESMKNLNQLKCQETGVLNTEKIMEGEVYVYIYLESDVVTEILNPLVTKITDVDKRNHIAVAWIKVKDLENLASLPGVKHVQSVVPPVINTGSVITEGDAIHKTADVRSLYSQSGAGMKVGIISNGVDHRSSAQSTGDLPADGAGLTVLSNSIGGDEGTAMLEIVHDMVPSSDLYFHDMGTSKVAFNNAIDDLVNAGCKVICDDVSWITEPFFEDGYVASHVASVISANDIIYVSAAGNSGSAGGVNQNCHYQGDYYPISLTNSQHDFSRGGSSDTYLYIHMPIGGTVRIILEWNDKFGSSANYYNLTLYNLSLNSIVEQSLNSQNGSGDPLEVISYTATTAGDYAIIVDKYSGIAKTLEVYIYPGNGTVVYINNITPIDAIFGQPAVVGAIAVGAVRATTPNTIESFSSQGPVTISYPSSEMRAKPDICGVDGVSITGAGGFQNPFYGTSAAASHIAAVAAQMWAAFPGETGNQIRDAIKSSAIDLGTAGFDNIYGWGRADAMSTYLSGALPVELVSFTALVEHTNAILRWRTATETNNYGFEVEKTAMTSKQLTLRSWEKIGFVQGNGTSNLAHSYSFTDQTINSGNYAYRLKQVDNSGAYKYSSEAEITIAMPEAFALSQNYPNPFNSETVLSFAIGDLGLVKLIIYDVLGQEVAILINEIKSAGLYTVKWNAASMPSGVYFCRLQTDHFVDNKKLVLLR